MEYKPTGSACWQLEWLHWMIPMHNSGSCIDNAEGQHRENAEVWNMKFSVKIKTLLLFIFPFSSTAQKPGFASKTSYLAISKVKIFVYTRPYRDGVDQQRGSPAQKTQHWNFQELNLSLYLSWGLQNTMSLDAYFKNDPQALHSILGSVLKEKTFQNW